MCVFSPERFHKKGKQMSLLIDKCLDIKEIPLNRSKTQLIFFLPNWNSFIILDKKLISYDP